MLVGRWGSYLLASGRVWGARKDCPRRERVMDARLPDQLSEAKTALRALRQSEATLRGFMQSATDSFMILDRNLRFVDLNEVAAARLGRAREAIVGVCIAEVSPRCVPSGRYERYQEVLRTGVPDRYTGLRRPSPRSSWSGTKSILVTAFSPARVLLPRSRTRGVSRFVSTRRLPCRSLRATSAN